MCQGCNPVHSLTMPIIKLLVEIGGERASGSIVKVQLRIIEAQRKWLLLREALKPYIVVCSLLEALIDKGDSRWQQKVGKRKDLLISGICKADRTQDEENVESKKEKKCFGKGKKENMEAKEKGKNVGS